MIKRPLIRRSTAVEHGDLHGDFVYGCERSRRRESVAGTPKHLRIVRRESLDQRTLAEPRFAGHKHELAGNRARLL